MKSTQIVFRVLLVLVLLAVGTAIALFIHHVGRPRIIARAVASDGTEMCIVQQCNWSAEQFTTSFVYRKPGTNWGWFYYDHEDGYWRKGRAILDTDQNTAVFYRGDAPAVTFKWDSETYTLHRWNRTMTNAQQWLPAGWSPYRSVYR